MVLNAWMSFPLIIVLFFVVLYFIFTLKPVRTLATTVFSKFLAWDTARLAKQKRTNPQLMKLNKELFSTMEEVIDNIGGPVLEIGAGSGAHLAFYPANTKLITIDLNEHFHPYLKTNLEENKHVTLDKYLLGNVNNMEGIVADNSCACVVSSLVLCCSDQGKAIPEIHRVLKPGGRFYFIEHVIEEPGTWTRWFQRKFSKTWESMRGNCCLTQTTDRNIQNFVGFVNLTAEIVYRSLAPQYFFAHRTYIGFADKKETSK